MNTRKCVRVFVLLRDHNIVLAGGRSAHTVRRLPRRSFEDRCTKWEIIPHELVHTAQHSIVMCRVMEQSKDNKTK